MSAGILHFLNKDPLKMVEFTASGAFQVPKNTNNIFILGCGGGGAGGTAASGQSGDGGQGAPFTTLSMRVTSLESLTITIGAGGTGVPGQNNVGNPGGRTTITGSLQALRFPGGKGGGVGAVNNGIPFEIFKPLDWATIGAIGEPSGSVFQGGNGENGLYANGGSGGVAASVFGDPPAGGGGASVGNGGNGGDRLTLTPTVGILGGGGGGGPLNFATTVTGANGGNGLIRIYYYENE